MTHPSIRQIELVETDQIIPFHANARTHSKKQIDKIARPMQQRGITNPLLLDENNVLLAGHGRLAAAVQLGLGRLPCIRMSGMSEDDKRAYRLADNQLALEAGWHFDLLAGELQFLVDADFDVGLTGFDDAEVDIILTEHQARSVTPASPDDETPPVAPGAEAVTRDGDLWILGSHRLLCGNARSGAALDRLMEEERADMAFTDAPYNVPINGHVGGNGRTRHREFAEASGEMTSDAYREFLRATLGNLARSCRDGAIVYSCIDWRHLPDMLAVGKELFTELKNLCVWNKTNAGMGSCYRSQHELVTVWKAGQAGHINSFGLGERGRHRSNVWTYAGVNTFRPGRIEELELHALVWSGVLRPQAEDRGMKTVRCAIYTRKSSEEGLEQAFNSLDAQREACAAYVLSQASEGWSALPDVYDDGGLSGGSLERPALQRPLADVAAGRIDIIVVYKVDRLTRSLLDFA